MMHSNTLDATGENVGGCHGWWIFQTMCFCGSWMMPFIQLALSGSSWTCPYFIKCNKIVPVVCLLLYCRHTSLHMPFSFDQSPVPVFICTLFCYGHWKIWPDMECPMQHMSRFDISPPPNACIPHCSSLIHYSTVAWHSCVENFCVILQWKIATFTCRCYSLHGWNFWVRSPTWYLCLKYVCCAVYTPTSDSNISEYIWQAFEHMYTTSCASTYLAQKSSCRILWTTM